MSEEVVGGGEKPGVDGEEEHVDDVQHSGWLHKPRLSGRNGKWKKRWYVGGGGARTARRRQPRAARVVAARSTDAALALAPTGSC